MNNQTEEKSVENYDLKSWLQIPKTIDKNWIQALDPEAYVLAFFDQGTRPDGRLFSQARQTKVVSSLLKHSAGSALVKQGGTKVLAAIGIEIGQPAPEFAEHGDVLVSVSTPDQGYADRLQSWLQRMLDDMLPPKLNLIAGKACIRLIISVMILEDSGNLMDASLLACMAAWKDTTLPTMDQLKESDGKLWWNQDPISSVEKIGDTPMHDHIEKEYRLSLTMGLLRGENEGEIKFLVDPSSDESEFTDGELTIVLNVSSRKLQIEYTGAKGLDASDLALAAKLANGRADELSSLLL